MAPRGERCGEPVIIRRRVRSRIDECHAHRPMVARAIKRIADPILAFFLLLLFSPVLLAIVVWILLDTGRPVLYTQVRAGKDARPFRMVKPSNVTMSFGGGVVEAGPGGLMSKMRSRL